MAIDKDMLDQLLAGREPEIPRFFEVSMLQGRCRLFLHGRFNEHGSHSGKEWLPCSDYNTMGQIT